MTNLDDAQKQQVIAWISEGLKLSEIQRRLESTFGIRLTYMEARFLMDDLKVTPKDVPPPPAPTAKTLGKAAPAPSSNANPLKVEKDPMPEEEAFEDEPPMPSSGKVSVTVDALARPGAVVSGNVTFSDGKSAAWFLDQQGRLGMAAKEQGYRPPPSDIQEFQIALQNELAKMGF